MDKRADANSVNGELESMSKLNLVYDRCLEKWGLESQILMLAEESAELTQASLKMLRKSEKSEKEQLKNLIEEIADVQIMIEEIEYFFKIGVDVSLMKAEKILRLVQILTENPT
jgi:NTP pyrophosphatase (non-canonical NTP hydrolase)